MGATDLRKGYGVIWGLKKSYGQGMFWILLVLFIGLFVLWNGVYYSFKRYIKKGMKDWIREIEIPMEKHEFENFLKTEWIRELKRKIF